MPSIGWHADIPDHKPLTISASMSPVIPHAGGIIRGNEVVQNYVLAKLRQRAIKRAGEVTDLLQLAPHTGFATSIGGEVAARQEGREVPRRLARRRSHPTRPVAAPAL